MLRWYFGHREPFAPVILLAHLFDHDLIELLPHRERDIGTKVLMDLLYRCSQSAEVGINRSVNSHLIYGVYNSRICPSHHCFQGSTKSWIVLKPKNKHHLIDWIFEFSADHG